jgi:conjugation system TraG family ATPase
MAQPVAFEKVFPIYKVESDCILSRQGDVTLAYEVTLPEIFTLSDQEYEAFHQVLVKAIKVLPNQSIFHKQDWFLSGKHTPRFESGDLSFLSRSSEQFFNERAYLDHQCYILLTRKAENRKPSSSVFSNLIRRSLVPEGTLSPQRMQEFFDGAGQFERILSDSGFVKLQRLTDDDLAGNARKPGLLERYCFLLSDTDPAVVKDIRFSDELRIGDLHCQLYSLSDVEDLPSLCGSRINYDRYSTDKTKFSVGFASPLGQLLSCDHIFNQYIFIEDAQKTIKQLESKRLRLQSLVLPTQEKMRSAEMPPTIFSTKRSLRSVFR